MSLTTRIWPDKLEAYFDEFTKRFLQTGSPAAADVEVLAIEWGDQYEVEGARIGGITYDPDTGSLEFSLDVGDHRVQDLTEVWAIEEPNGFISAVEVVRANGLRDIVSLKQVGLRRLMA